MKIILQRIYDQPRRKGYRVLVDRLWPRGITRDKAALDEWCKDLSPSPQLRVWYGHDPVKWPEFRKRYRKELEKKKDVAHEILKRAGKKDLLLLYGAKDEGHTHALVLKDFLESVSGAIEKTSTRKISNER